MKRNKNTFSGINCIFLTFAAIIWLGVAMPLKLLAQTGFTHADKTDSLDEVNALKEVKIRTIKITRRQTSSTPLQILSGSELQQLNSLSVADAVRFFSGVQLKDYGGIGGLKTINVRSMGTNHTAVFYDGVQLGNAQNGQIDLGKFSLDNIEEIELYNGQKSTIFQSAKGFAAASSLYLKAKKPVFEAQQNDLYRLGFKTGSFGLINPAVSWHHKLSNSFNTNVSTEYRKANGRYKFRYTNGVYDTTAVRNNSDIESLRVEAGLSGIFKDSSSWSAKIYLYNDAQGLPGAIVANKFNYSQRQWNRNFFVQSVYQKDFSRYRIQATAKYANDYLRYLDPEYVTSKGFLDNKFHQQELYLSLVNQYKITDIWTAVLSADLQHNTLDANIDYFPYPARNTLLAALATQIQWNRFDIQANLLGTYVADQVKQYYAAGNKYELTPAIMVSWQPFNQKEFRLRSFYKSIFRMPTFNDLYYTAVGNVNLKPEYTKQYDLGFTYIRPFDGQLLNQLSIQADGYFNQVKNKIVAVPGANLFRWSMSNLDKVEIKGLDINLQSNWILSNTLNLSAGLTYTYQQALDVTPGNYSYRRQIPYTPVNSGSVILGADWKQFLLNYSYLYTGARYNQKANVIYNYVEPWYTHDITLHYNFKLNTSIKTAAIRLTAEVNNLFNQYYDVIANFPMPGRNYRFTLSYNL